MKKFTILLVTLFLTLTAAAQHPGKKPELLVGKELIVNATPFIDMGFSDFYTSTAMTYVNRYEPVQMYSSYTTTSALAGKKFKVTGVEKLNNAGEEVLFLKLLGDNDLTLYYKYTPDFDQDFPFKVVGGLAMPKGFYCTYVTRAGAGFESEMADGITFYKSGKGAAAKYTMLVNQAGGEQYVPGMKGVTIYLNGNKKIQKDKVAISGGVNSLGSFYYSATFSLTAADIALLKTNTIINTKLNIFESEVTSGEKLKGIFNCLITK
jgi:hypothetical protein